MTAIERPGIHADAEGIREEKPLTVVGPKTTARQRISAVWQYRELLGAMTNNVLKVQYKDSVLGFVWSLVNPAVVLGVYFVVFQVILKNGIPRFAILLTAGVLAWNFFAIALPSACSSVVANAGIIKKVSFPREIPALAAVGSAGIQMGLQAVVLVIFMVAFRHGPAMAYVPLLIPALIALVLLSGALGVLFAAINVKYRDLTYLLQVALNVWFWMCPIVYAYRLIADRIDNVHSHYYFLFIIYRLNPMTPIVLTFERALYGATSPGGAHILPPNAGPFWYLWQDLAVIAFGILLFWVALRVFSKAEGDFADSL
jgi:ABC-2 type transport system permease protein